MRKKNRLPARGRGLFPDDFPDGSAAADIVPVTLRHMLREAMRHGVSPALLCEGMGFTPDDLETEDFRLSRPQCTLVIRRALRLLQRPTLGLELGVRVNLVSWGPIGLGFMASGSSRELLELAIAFQQAAGRLPALYGETSRQSYCLVAKVGVRNSEVASFLVDETFAALGQICRQVVGTHFNPRQVDLVMERPPYGAVYEDVFRCSVRFGQAENRMYFPLEPYAVRTADPLVLRQVVRWLGPLEDGEPATALETTVVHAIRRNLAAPPHLREVATQLHTSERTLRRRLAAIGRSYAELLSEERRTRALSLIAHSTRAMRDIAQECGFADVRTLQRAIKRWTGLSPSGLRRRARQDAEPEACVNAACTNEPRPAGAVRPAPAATACSVRAAHLE